MGRNKKGVAAWSAGDNYNQDKYDDKYDDIWKRKRKARINHTPSKLNVDIHGILFAVVALVFVVYPLMQWALGR